MTEIVIKVSGREFNIELTGDPLIPVQRNILFRLLKKQESLYRKRYRRDISLREKGGKNGKGTERHDEGRVVGSNSENDGNESETIDNKQRTGSDEGTHSKQSKDDYGMSKTRINKK